MTVMACNEDELAAWEAEKRAYWQSVYDADKQAYYRLFDDFRSTGTAKERKAVLRRIARLELYLGKIYDTAEPQNAANLFEGYTRAQSHLLSAQLLRVLAGAEPPPFEWPETVGPLCESHTVASDPADRVIALDALKAVMQPVIGWQAADVLHSLSNCTPAPRIDGATGEIITEAQHLEIALGFLRRVLHDDSLPPDAAELVRRALAEKTNSPKET